MKHIFIVLFILLTAGCSSPGKPSFYYTWTQYSTGVNIKNVNEPKHIYGEQGILRLDDDGEYALIVIYNGGSVSSHFGYVTKENINEWIKIFTDFLDWKPKSTNEVKTLTIHDDVMLFHKQYTVEYSNKDNNKFLLINNDARKDFIVDYSRLAIDEKNVRKLLDIYISLKNKLQ